MLQFFGKACCVLRRVGSAERPRAAAQVREAHAVSSTSDVGPSLGACFKVQSWDRPWPWRHTATLVSDCNVAPLASSINF